MLRRIAGWAPPGGPDRAPARAAHDADARRPGDRAARRLGRRRRRADLLPGADRQRGLPAHGDRAPLGPRAGARDRLRAQPGRGGRAPTSSGRSSAASRRGPDAAGHAAAAARGARRRRARRCRACPGRTSCRRRSRRAPTWSRAATCNELRPRLTVPQPVSLGSTELFVEGIATGFVRGDRVLITAPGRTAVSTAGSWRDGPPQRTDRELAQGAVEAPPSLLEVTDVVPEPELGRARGSASWCVAKFPPPSQPPAPTTDRLDAGPPVRPADPPPLPPVAPAELEPPVYDRSCRAR